MKKLLILSLGIVLALLLYLFFTLCFLLLFRQVSDKQPASTSTPMPTFTLTSAATIPVIVGVTPATQTPTPIPVSQNPSSAPEMTPTPIATPTDLPTATTTPTPVIPQVIASIAVNIRSGPGTSYPVSGSLLPDSPLLVIGRNEQNTWWQVQQADGTIGWVSASVVEASNVDGIPIAQSPPPPEPTPTPVPPPPTRPVYQFEPTGWYDDANLGLTRFLGNITDVNGNPVNGVTIEVQCGTYRIISNPSGPVGGFDSNDSADDPPGFYDITVARKPVPCTWLLTVVYTEDGKTVLSRLSETIEIEVTVDKSIIVANWRKNW